MSTSPGQLAYEAYCAKRNWKAFDNSPLPFWDHVVLDIQGAWNAAAEAVIRAVVEKANVVDVRPEQLTLRLDFSQPVDAKGA